MKKVQQKRGASKKAAARSADSGQGAAGGARRTAGFRGGSASGGAGIEPIPGVMLAEAPKGERYCVFDHAVVVQLDAILARAAESAIEAAPQEIPRMHGRHGAEAAIDACRAISKVRKAFAQAMTGGVS